MKYQAPNGEIVIVRDEIQASAFEREGFVLVEDKPKRQPKSE